jgi:hypothetical protein
MVERGLGQYWRAIVAIVLGCWLATIDFTGSMASAQGLVEVNPPEAIVNLTRQFAKVRPQVKIVSPQADEIVTEDRISARWQVSNFSTTIDPSIGVAPYLQVYIDDRILPPIYDLTAPLEIDRLDPGTHTLRAFAVLPWKEIAHTPGAYAQTTFHVYDRSDNTSSPNNLPTLTYHQPHARVTTTPVLLDFYLNSPTNPPNGNIEVTLDKQKFRLNDTKPIYLNGLTPGKHVIHLNYTDDRGNPLPTTLPTPPIVFEYAPDPDDPLARLFQGKPPLPPVVEILPTPIPIPIPAPTPIVSTTPLPTPIAKNEPTPVSTPEPQVVPVPEVKTEPKSIPSPTPIVSPPEPIPSPPPIVSPPEPIPSPPPIAPPIPNNPIPPNSYPPQTIAPPIPNNPIPNNPIPPNSYPPQTIAPPIPNNPIPPNYPPNYPPNPYPPQPIAPPPGYPYPPQPPMNGYPYPYYPYQPIYPPPIR